MEELKKKRLVKEQVWNNNVASRNMPRTEVTRFIRSVHPHAMYVIECV